LNNRLKAEKLRTASAAYDAYSRARAEILAMREGVSSNAALTASEHELLAGLDELWQADGESVADLRRFGKTITGVRRSNYKGERAEVVKARLDRDRLKLLEHGDPALWVNEPAALGGFGLRVEDAFYNEDTLRFFRIVCLLNDAVLTREFRARTPRATVWEIGGGWGGFAHYFKTLFPDVTYLITAPPSLLLLSATYLTTLFPDATCRFFQPSNPDAFWHDWDRADFAFAPDSAIDQLRPRQIAITLDIGALQRMNADRIAAHVQRAFDLGCRYVLSVCLDDDPATTMVRSAVDERYWPHPMSARPYLDRHLLVRSGAFLLGWKRLHG
jgi:putative sugar O-methyltransferase